MNHQKKHETEEIAFGSHRFLDLYLSGPGYIGPVMLSPHPLPLPLPPPPPSRQVSRSSADFSDKNLGDLKQLLFLWIKNMLLR